MHCREHDERLQIGQEDMTWKEIALTRTLANGCTGSERVKGFRKVIPNGEGGDNRIDK